MKLRLLPPLIALLAIARAAEAPPPAALQTEFVYEALVTLSPTLEIGRDPLGTRRAIPITGGSFHGPRLHGTILPGGADWQLERSDGVTEVNALYSMRCDDGTVIVVHNRGVISVGGTYLRTSPLFDVPAGPHEWLRKAVFVGSIAASDQPNAVVIRVFRVL